MDWKKQLKADEKELKALVDKLADMPEGMPEGGSISRSEREIVLRSLGQKVVEMRAFVDECLGGRSDHEQAIAEYRLRIEYPLFAHLSTLSSLSREYIEWSCA
jgi:hypothetical protein